MNSWSQGSTPSLSPTSSPSLLRNTWGADIVHLPANLENEIKIAKGHEPLGTKTGREDYGRMYA